MVGTPVLTERRVIRFIRDFSQGHDVAPFLVCTRSPAAPTPQRSSARPSIPHTGSSLPLYLLYAPLKIPLVCCHINSFRRASRGGEAMARRRKKDRWAGHRITRNVQRLG